MAEAAGVDRAVLALLDPDGSFRARLVADRARLAELAGELRSAVPAIWHSHLQELEIITHRLGGTAGTFGFATVSAAALELEDRVLTARAAAGASPHRQGIAAGLARLDAALAAGLAAVSD